MLLRRKSKFLPRPRRHRM